VKIDLIPMLRCPAFPLMSIWKEKWVSFGPHRYLLVDLTPSLPVTLMLSDDRSSLGIRSLMAVKCTGESTVEVKIVDRVDVDPEYSNAQSIFDKYCTEYLSPGK
jgi:hypothetical protein